MRAWSTRFRAPLALVFRWTSVWLPALLCAQLLVRGLVPAERERSRLTAEEARMEERVRAELDRRAALERDLAKLADPIWRERVRRSLQVAGAEPLTLERSYVGALEPR
jgi:hypothetical protein